MKMISDKAVFFIFLQEKYAEAKNVSSKDVLKLWKEKELIDYINNMYEQYHTERVENAIQDIDEKLLGK